MNPVLKGSVRKRLFAVALASSSALAFVACPQKANEPPTPVASEIATFGAGCFWHVEAVFRQIKGVTATSVGFMGGLDPNPSYGEVCAGATGHTEVVRVKYDPARVSYNGLLDAFWSSHDPAAQHVETQYRSVIFFRSPEQEAAAKASIERMQSSRAYKNHPITTRIEPASEFYIAEDYHQQYYEKHGLAKCKM